ncbi:unnamed protein product [Parnassius mnemosyne]|uniref:THAP-type domain-containing protein n=1 Tax=Parnassius mnemosyne TaxID=213953 RepID=A0AAV1LS21_9NEOP
MFRKCCVSECNSLRQDVRLHQLPANKDIRNRWLQCIGYSNLVGKSSEITKNMYVCHKHFEQKFINPKTNRLKCFAYPSLFTDLEISLGNPSIDFKETDSKTMTIDHKYAKKRHIDHSYSQLAESASNKLPRLTVSVTSTLTPVENAVASSSSEIQDAQVTLTTMEHSIAAFSTHAIASSGTTSQDTQQGNNNQNCIYNIESA